MWTDMLMNYLSLKYSESIQAFQQALEHLKPKVNIFDGEKKKRHFNEWFSRQVDLLYFGYLADLRFLKSVFKGILNTLYVFKAATYVE